MDEALARELIVFAVLGASLVLFVFGKWRYDVVAIAALPLWALLGALLATILPLSAIIKSVAAVVIMAAISISAAGALGGGHGPLPDGGGWRKQGP